MDAARNDDTTPTRTIRLTADELARMDAQTLAAILVAAVEIRGTAYVRRADGTIKYDDPTQAGQFGEEGESNGSGPVRA